jgi:hypothetical protein
MTSKSLIYVEQKQKQPSKTILSIIEINKIKSALF